MVDQVNHKE